MTQSLVQSRGWRDDDAVFDENALRRLLMGKIWLSEEACLWSPAPPSLKIHSCLGTSNIYVVRALMMATHPATSAFIRVYSNFSAIGIYFPHNYLQSRIYNTAPVKSHSGRGYYVDRPKRIWGRRSWYGIILILLIHFLQFSVQFFLCPLTLISVLLDTK
jgi:hypothetical protein